MKKNLLLLAAAALVITSCKQQEVAVPVQGNAVDFHASIGTYALRATDTSFENGDEVTIMADAPISSGPVKYVYSKGQLTSDNPICWLAGQKEKTEFELLYPYDPKVSIDMKSYEFTVNADQSTHKLYTASDLMTGYGEATPGSPVNLKVDHMNSKVHIYINNLSDKSIKDVFFSGVYGKVRFSSESGIQPIGTKGTVMACPVYADSVQSWVLIIPAQTSQPELLVTTSDGEQITYTLPAPFNFQSGYQANAFLTLSEDNVFTNFTTTVIDWQPDNNLQFSNGGTTDEEWKYLGKGKFMDDILASLFGVEHFEMDVDVFEDNSQPGRYKIQDPYKNWPYRESFDYKDGASIIVNSNVFGQIYIEEGSSTGIMHYNYGEITVMTPCPEIGYENSDEYGYNYTDGCTHFYGQIWACVEAGHWITNDNYLTIFTLPGYTRYPAFYDVEELFYDAESRTISTTAPIDAKRFALSVIDGRGITQTDLDETLAGTHSGRVFYTEDNYGDQVYNFSFPTKPTGIYTILAAGDFTYIDGEYYFGYWSETVGYVAPGDEAPACTPEIISANTCENSPASAVEITVKVPDIKTAYYLVMTAEGYRSFDIGSDSIANYVLGNGKFAGGSISGYEKGQKITVSGLNPNTEYVIILAARNVYDQTGYAIAKASTAGELEFKSIGYGMYMDQIILSFVSDSSFPNYYYSSVEILQEKSGKPIYRVMKPFNNLYSTYSSPTIAEYRIDGNGAEYIEFYTREFSSGTYVFYNPYNCGVTDMYVSEDGNPLVYKHYSGDVYEYPELYTGTMYNKQIAEGVFQFAPQISLSGTSYYYNFMNEEEAVIICLPGYSYTFSWEQASPASKRLLHKKPQISERSKYFE